MPALGPDDVSKILRRVLSHGPLTNLPKGIARVLLDAYGLEQTREVEETLTRYCLVHEFVTLGDFLERYPAESSAGFKRLLWGE